jgi:hypothetical protein
MSATLESRTLIVSARRLRVLKAALAGTEIEAIEPAEWVTTGVRARVCSSRRAKRRLRMLYQLTNSRYEATIRAKPH